MKLLVLFIIIIITDCISHAWQCAQNPPWGRFKKKRSTHINYNWKIAVQTNPEKLTRYETNIASLCESSWDCPNYCCEIIKESLNICCNDPSKALEFSRKRPGFQPIPIPIPIPDTPIWDGAASPK